MKKYIVILVVGLLLGLAGKTEARGYYHGGYRGGYGYHNGYEHRGYYCAPRPCVVYRPYHVWIPGFWGWNRWHEWVWFNGYWR